MRQVVCTLAIMATVLVSLAQGNATVVARVQQLLEQSQTYIHDIDVERALNCATEARRQLDAAGLSHHPLYAEALLCQAQVMSDHDQIVSMMSQCHTIVKDMTDIDKSIDYDLQMARILSGLSDATLDDYRQAMSILDEAAGILEALSANGHHDLEEKYTIPILLYAEEIAFACGNYDGAQDLLNQALEQGARPATTGYTYEDSQMWQRLIAYQLEIVDATSGHPDDLDDLCKAYYFMLTQDAAYQFKLLPKEQYTGYALRSSAAYNFLHHLCIKYRQHPALESLAYDAALFSRALTRRLTHWEQYYQMTPDSLHKELTLAYLLRQANKWENVKSGLQLGEGAIEFVSGYAIHQGHYQGEKTNAAIVLRHDGQPTIVPLSSSSELIDILKQTGDAQSVLQQLYQALWLPIEQHLGGIRHIYYAPSGFFSVLPLAALRNAHGELLCERYNLELLSTTGSGVLDYLKSWRTPKNAMLFGDIAYGGKPFSGAYRYALRGNVAPLDNSMIELSAIQNRLKQHRIKAQLLNGSSATERAIKQLSGKSPELLHIVTHGFYISQSIRQDYVQALKALNVTSFHELTALGRCGLLMAGANRAWTTGDVSPGQDDGILTGEEIAALDLSGCRLVVLSACETGLGDITDYEGVMGLQRAFKLAGVQTIVMSLWKVRDDVTALLMTRFYEHLLSGATPHEAMRTAQQEIRQDYPDVKDWAAFVVLD